MTKLRKTGGEKKSVGERMGGAKVKIGRRAAKSLGKGKNPLTGSKLTSNAKGLAMSKEAAKMMVSGTIQANRAKARRKAK